MSHKKEYAELIVGAVQEVASKAGVNLGHPHGVAGKTGAAAIAAVPVIAAKAGIVAGTVASGVSVAAVAVAPLAVGAGIAYGVYRLGRWLVD